MATQTKQAPKKKPSLSAQLTNPRNLLPAMLIIGFFVLWISISDIWDSVASGRLFAPAATAAETKTEAPAPPEAPAAKAEKESVKPPADTQPAIDDTETSPAEFEVLKQLSDRRTQLDKRAHDLDTRENLIQVTEQRVDQKIKEMETLRQQLNGMVNQASEAQAVQLDNLVKIYETMKPEEAARIFETLDMPVLLGVIQKMKPARTAPIMAKMAPEKARELTIALTRQDQLPQAK